MVITTRTPARTPINLTIRDRHAIRGVVACDDMLAPDERRLDVVDPDEIRADERDGVAAPDVLRVELGDVDVLYDDVGAAGYAEAFAADHAGGAFADDGLVVLDVDRGHACGVVGYGDDSLAVAPILVR